MVKTSIYLWRKVKSSDNRHQLGCTVDLIDITDWDTLDNTVRYLQYNLFS